MLHELPIELLNQIVSELSTAQSLAHLSRANRALQKYTQSTGWKVFVQSQFPSLDITGPNQRQWDEASCWDSAAHSLTTLSRNLDRKAFLARYIEPANLIVKLPQRELETQWRRPKSQTMGYQPTIDCYEESTGHAWNARKQVLAWGAGAELVLRVKNMGGGKQKADSRGTYSYYDHFNHHTRWFTHRPPRAMEGKDDITSLNVLKGPYREDSVSSTDVEHIITGTASGKLSLSHLELDRDTTKTLGAVFDTSGKPVKSAHVEPSHEGLLAACLGDLHVALYQIPTFLYNAPEQHEVIKPLCEHTLPRESIRSYRTWSTQFLSQDCLALGTGPSRVPIRIFKVTPTGLVSEPLRDAPEMNDISSKSSVYPIKPLSSSIGHKQASGQLFLSGGYDGIVRLHDLRSPQPCKNAYFDATDDGAIYSLQTMGRERFVAGASRHSMLKFFDLRMTGGRAYDYRDINDITGSGSEHPQRSNHNRDVGWNVYLNHRNEAMPNCWARQRNRAIESPIYSLSSPSSASPTLFAGVENHIVELDFISMLDKHPDSIFSRGIVRDRRKNIHITKSWDPKHDVLSFAMYKNVGSGLAKLRMQAPVGMYEGAIDDLDERWRGVA